MMNAFEARKYTALQTKTNNEIELDKTKIVLSDIEDKIVEAAVTGRRIVSYDRHKIEALSEKWKNYVYAELEANNYLVENDEWSLIIMW